MLSGLKCCLSVNWSTLVCFSASAQMCWRATSLVLSLPGVLGTGLCQCPACPAPERSLPEMPVCFMAFPAQSLLSRIAGFMYCPAVSWASPSREWYQLALGEKSRAVSRGAGIGGSAAPTLRGSGQPANRSKENVGLQQTASTSKRGK